MSSFKVGDRVRYVGNPSAEWATGVVVAAAQGLYEVLPDGKYRYGAGCAVRRGAGTFHPSALKPAEAENPRFKPGDKVRYETGRYGAPKNRSGIGEVTEVHFRPRGDAYYLVNTEATQNSPLVYLENELAHSSSQQLKLERGDRIVNNLTKRKGYVVLGSDDELWVVGNDMDEDTGCHASAVEEYEEHYPGTYEITQKASPF